MKRKGGFTIAELSIVIAVIAILAIIVVAAYGNYQQRTRDSIRKSDLQQIAAALKSYLTWNGNYTTSCGNGGDGFIGVSSADGSVSTVGLSGSYAANSVVSCLQSAGYLRPQDGTDPSGCRYNSGGTCGGNPVKAYMKETCQVNGKTTVYLLAYLETGTANNSTIDNLCSPAGKTWGTTYGMNYYISLQ